MCRCSTPGCPGRAIQVGVVSIRFGGRDLCGALVSVAGARHACAPRSPRSVFLDDPGHQIRWAAASPYNESRLPRDRPTRPAGIDPVAPARRRAPREARRGKYESCTSLARAGRRRRCRASDAIASACPRGDEPTAPVGTPASRRIRSATAPGSRVKPQPAGWMSPPDEMSIRSTPRERAAGQARRSRRCSSRHRRPSRSPRSVPRAAAPPARGGQRPWRPRRTNRILVSKLPPTWKSLRAFASGERNSCRR